MPSPTSQALAELYASGGDAVELVGVELSHPSLAAPIRVVANVRDDMQLPLVIGNPATALHTACAFQVTLPGQDEDGPTDAKVRIDNVSGLLRQPLRDAIGANMPISVLIRTYICEPPTLTPVLEDVIGPLQLKSVTLTATTAEGTLTLEDGRTVNFPTGPNAFFDLANYPALFAR